MNWTEIRIEIACRDAERAADIANMVVPYGLYIEDYSDLEESARTIAHIDLIDEALIAKDRTVAVLHIYVSPEDNPREAVAYLEERFSAEGIAYRLDEATVAESDWADNWKQYFHPIEIGERLAICTSWEEYDNAAGRRVLTIDPGAAFGTGTHDTTKLCLTVLERVCRAGDTLLDVGCGSGILALSALVLGCETACGVDIDPLAVKVAKENASLNGLADRVDFVCGDLVEAVTGRYDVVCANIVADVIIKLCDSVPPFLKEDGLFVCSGIIDTREADVTAKLCETGFAVKERMESGGWVALVCEKERNHA
ncbi:MAG: 50S ribosomal protein L11 methyltransferase [Clostridia bacterium]|nr:50S ribosomal protein L11 methyltransferase [Clostridia bacterium]